MTSSGTGSLAVWVRSPDFNISMSIYDPTGALTGSDSNAGISTSNGWTMPGDISSAAVNVPLAQVGTYQIQLSSSNGVYGTGSFSMSISPGADLKLQFIVPSGGNPTDVFVISSSNHIAICETAGGKRISFYNIITNAIDNWYDTTTGSNLNSYYGACYSKQQDRVFSLVRDTSGGDHFAIVEFNNTGSLISSSSLAPTFVSGAFSIIPTMCYDQVNDKIFVMRKGVTTALACFITWDCASRTIDGGVTYPISPLPAATTTGDCTYSDINNRYYISYVGSAVDNFFMTWVDASNVNSSGSTSALCRSFIQYNSGSNRIICGRNNTGSSDIRGLAIIDPVADALSYTGSALWLPEATAYDPCSQVSVVAINTNINPNGNGLLCFDSSSNVVNFIPIRKEAASEDLWGMCFVETGSRMYMSIRNSNTTRSIYSCKISVPTGSILFVDPFPPAWDAWWTMDSGSKSHEIDSVGGLDLALQMNPFFASTGSGKVNNALIFNGDSGTSVSSVYSGSGLAFSGIGTTVVCWLNLSDVTASVLNYADFYYGFDQNGIEYFIGLERYGSAPANWTLTMEAATINIASATGWHFFAITFDANSGNVSFDIDRGVTTTQFAAIPGAGSNTAGYVNIGCSGNTGAKILMNVDEVAIYNRVLTSGQLDYLYNSGTGRTWPVTLP